MPPSAVQPNPAPYDAAGALADASERLEAALARLEALVEAGPLQSELFRSADPDEPRGLEDGLAAARRRQAALETAAAEASVALGRAMVEVRQVLEGDAGEGIDDEEADPSGLDPGIENAKESGP